ncbi:unnamed protein product, partial [Allacma fusca]
MDHPRSFWIAPVFRTGIYNINTGKAVSKHPPYPILFRLLADWEIQSHCFEKWMEDARILTANECQGEGLQLRNPTLLLSSFVCSPQSFHYSFPGEIHTSILHTSVQQ